jgi:hypothetical protein
MKNNKNIKIIFLIFLAFGILNCTNSNKQKPSETGKIPQNEEIQKTEVNKTHCFRNEYNFAEEPGVKDVQEIQLTINGDKVTGAYNWLPAYKDQRKGSLKGIIRNDTIICQYNFSQEGIEDSANLKIVLINKKAIISGGKIELGLNATISEIDCENY